MSPLFAISLFLGITFLLILLPFVPSLKELRQKKDAEPLRVVSASEVDIRHFALRFSRFVSQQLGEAMGSCRDTSRTVTGALDDGTPYVIVPNGDSPFLTESESSDQTARRMILSCADLRLPDETMFLPELYAAGTIHGGHRNIYRAILADEGIHLAPESMSLRWLHAGTVAWIAKGALLYGRVSANEKIVMDGDCVFERLHAPHIVFGSEERQTDTPRQERQRRELKADDLPHLIDDSAGRWLYELDLEIPPGRLIRADIVCMGEITVGRGTRIEGSVKSREKLRIDPGVEITGSAVSGSNLALDRSCAIGGPVIAEGDVTIEPGTIIGTAGTPTTVSGGNITAAAGTTVHGTVWAHQTGKSVQAVQPQRGEHGGGKV